MSPVRRFTLDTLFDRFERGTVIGLLALMTLVLMLATVELAILIVQETMNAPEGLLFLDISELLGLFGYVFLLLIGLEIFQTIKMYLHDDTIHAEFVILVAITALARKVILLDMKVYPPLMIFGIGALLLALAIAYFLLSRRAAGAAGADD